MVEYTLCFKHVIVQINLANTKNSIVKTDTQSTKDGKKCENVVLVECMRFLIR